MGIDDRDYMRERAKRYAFGEDADEAPSSRDPRYDPKQFRHTRAPGDHLLPGYQTPQASGSTLLGRLVLLVVIVLAILGYRHIAQGRDLDLRALWASIQAKWDRSVSVGSSSPASTRPALASTLWCEDAQPAESRQWPAAAALPAPYTRPVQIRNLSGRPVFVALNEVGPPDGVATALIYPGDTWSTTVANRATTSATVSLGSRWCNGKSGWVDGQAVSIMGGLRPDPTSSLGLLEIRPGRGDTAPVSFIWQDNRDASAWGPAQAPPPRAPAATTGGRQSGISSFEVPGTEFVALRWDGRGYWAAGSINSVPVEFLVDTGAGVTAVPSSLGAQLGIENCVPRTFRTASGKAQGCVGRVASLVVGPFRLRDAEVAMLPTLAQPLLGMNMLGHLEIVASGRDTILRQR